MRFVRTRTPWQPENSEIVSRENLLEATRAYWAHQWTCEVSQQIVELGLDPSATLLDLIHKQVGALGFEGMDEENRAPLYLDFETAALAMFTGPSPQRDEELLKERNRLPAS